MVIEDTALGCPCASSRYSLKLIHFSLQCLYHVFLRLQFLLHFTQLQSSCLKVTAVVSSFYPDCSHLEQSEKLTLFTHKCDGIPSPYTKPTWNWSVVYFPLKANTNVVCVFMHVWMCLVCVCMQMCTQDCCMWKPKASIRNLPWLIHLILWGRICQSDLAFTWQSSKTGMWKGASNKDKSVYFKAIYSRISWLFLDKVLP